MCGASVSDQIIQLINFSTQWTSFLKVINDDDDLGDTVTVANDWARETSLKVEIVNNFDHDQDGTPTAQNVSQTFDLLISK